MTTSPAILAADAPLDHAALDRALSVLSYNVLLPNTGAGWWIFKFYDPSVPEPARTWPHRHALLQRQLTTARADVVCLQETTPGSFDQDFAFLHDEGYDHALHRKGELRCATFWRRDRLALAADARHPDRVLVTALRAASDPSRLVLVLNGHLKAGSDAGRRLRQVDEALGEAARIARALGQTPGQVPVVFCGDFNSDPAGSAVSALLRTGEVTPDFREPGHADALTSRHRTQPFGRFEDAHAQAFGAAVPATMLVHNHHRYFVDDEGMLRPSIVEAVRALFARFAGGQPFMDRAAVTAWITAINRAPERGSEWAKAQAIFEARGVEQLTADDLVGLYVEELREGKSWGVYHDLCACGVAPERAMGAPNEWRFDLIHHTSQLPLLAVRALLTDDQRQAVFARGERLPNAWHPSDHLPVSAVFAW